MVVGGEGSFDRCADGVVVPDGGGEREEALPDSGEDACDGAAAVAFEIELAFECLIDRLDGLPEWFEKARSCSVGLPLRAGRSRVISLVVRAVSNSAPK